jgi:hypothetical protein
MTFNRRFSITLQGKGPSLQRNIPAQDMSPEFFDMDTRFAHQATKADRILGTAVASIPKARATSSNSTYSRRMSTGLDDQLLYDLWDEDELEAELELEDASSIDTSLRASVVSGPVPQGLRPRPPPFPQNYQRVSPQFGESAAQSSNAPGEVDEEMTPKQESFVSRSHAVGEPKNQSRQNFWQQPVSNVENDPYSFSEESPASYGERLVLESSQPREALGARVGERSSTAAPSPLPLQEEGPIPSFKNQRRVPPRLDLSNSRLPQKKQYLITHNRVESPTSVHSDSTRWSGVVSNGRQRLRDLKRSVSRKPILQNQGSAYDRPSHSEIAENAQTDLNLENDFRKYGLMNMSSLSLRLPSIRPGSPLEWRQSQLGAPEPLAPSPDKFAIFSESANDGSSEPARRLHSSKGKRASIASDWSVDSVSSRFLNRAGDSGSWKRRSAGSIEQRSIQTSSSRRSATSKRSGGSALSKTDLSQESALSMSSSEEDSGSDGDYTFASLEGESIVEEYEGTDRDDAAAFELTPRPEYVKDAPRGSPPSQQLPPLPGALAVSSPSSEKRSSMSSRGLSIPLPIQGASPWSMNTSHLSYGSASSAAPSRNKPAKTQELEPMDNPSSQSLMFLSEEERALIEGLRRKRAEMVQSSTSSRAERETNFFSERPSTSDSRYRRLQNQHRPSINQDVEYEGLSRNPSVSTEASSIFGMYSAKKFLSTTPHQVTDRLVPSNPGFFLDDHTPSPPASRSPVTPTSRPTDGLGIALSAADCVSLTESAFSRPKDEIERGHHRRRTASSDCLMLDSNEFDGIPQHRNDAGLPYLDHRGWQRNIWIG